MLSRSTLFSPSTLADGWLAVSGQLGVDPESGRLVEGVLAQTMQALTNLRNVLDSAGADLGSIVKVNVYLTDMADYDEMNRAYVESFEGLRMPSRTAIAVAGLPRGASVEIEAWAYVLA